MGDGDLGGRKAAVLRVLVEEYVRTGEPVGSETIAERAALGVSSATIRNEMAALEELGYLSHPHTSAGRIPTDVGYRYYVDSLPSGKLRETQRRAISEFYAEAMLDMEEILKGTTQLLSRLTQYAGLAVAPSAADERVLRVELIELGSALLVLVVGELGRVDKQVVDRPVGMTEPEVATVARRLTEMFSGMELSDATVRARQMTREAHGSERDLLSAVAVTLGQMQQATRGDHVLVGGVANLAGEAAQWRRETVRRLFEALERESEMLRLLRESPAQLSVTIGAEDPATQQWEAAIVAAPYRSGDNSLGTIGVVGPTRMDYLSVMTAVQAVAKRVSELATALGI
jgi:heat-inducible transcriptional repressor